VVLNAQKPRSPKYPKELKTVGDHIRKKRLDLGLIQKEAASRIGVSEATVYNWERNASAPQVKQLPGVVRFLGHYPYPPAGSFSDKLMAVRRKLGLSRKAMATRLGVDPTTLASWEKGKRRASTKLQRTVADFLREAGLGLKCPCSTRSVQ